MDAKLRDALAYLCAKYPHKEELSKARLTKMVYLADWRSALLHGRQITGIRWRFNHYGPYVDDVLTLAKEDPMFDLVFGENLYGTPKVTISLAGRAPVKWDSLDKEDREILDFVIEATAPKFWDDFIRLVYSTYPVITQPRYTGLDLVSLAREYHDRSDLG